jgi:predicted AlkP superfamily phosphohydrolase/phosphomutase
MQRNAADKLFAKSSIKKLIMKEKRVLVIGLDCLAPQLVLDRWLDQLPTIKSLLGKSVYGPLKSCVPPITVPAWACMTTSKNPGALGIYGFRNRFDHSYAGLSVATGKEIQEDRVWDILSRAGKKVIVIGVPQTYPPKEINGYMITGFLTPDTSCQYTYPPAFKQEVEGLVGEYILDVDNFRTDRKDDLLKQIYRMTEKRFTLVKHLLNNKPWDFFMMVELGPDRLHHGFWSYADPDHRNYEPGSPYEHVILDYYKYLDRELAEILSLTDDYTITMIVSDHGAQAMAGGVCINEWLIQEGYLTLLEKPPGIVSLAKAKIDWERTFCWGEGGYYSRIFFNVRGREPQGVIPPHNYEEVRTEIAKKLEAMCDEKGKPLGTRVFKPEEVYPEVRGIPPELIVYFGDLKWRSVGSIGYGTTLTFENDLGPDDANHLQHGVCIIHDPLASDDATPVPREDLDILDISPTILDRMGIRVPDGMEGKVIAG